MDLGRGIAPEALEVRALLSGQTVQLIKDVNAVETYPSNLTPVGSNLFYTIEDSSGSGQELVATSSSGTTVLHDFGTSSYGYGYSYGSPIRLTGVGDSLFFTLGYGASQLWTSDGTAGGTAQVSVPGSSDGYVQDLTAVSGKLIFTTSNYTSSGEDYELWAVSPGSTSATLVKDFSTSSISSVGTIGGTAYLSVGGNLWTTDGTAANTVELEDSSNKPIPAPEQVFSYQGQVDYLSSGTTSSTIGVLASGGETATITGLPASVADIDVVGSSFYFTAASSASTYGPHTQLWISNGTQAGTVELKDFSSIAASAAPSNFAAVDGSLFFTIKGSDGLAQLWTSNGTGQGTSLVKDLGVEATYSYSYYNQVSGGVLQPIGGMLYFTAYDSTHGAELWSDNVATGTTQLVDDINPGSGSSDPQNLADFGGQLYFSANDGTSPVTAQLWTSGGTAGTTAKVASFSPGQTQGSASSLSNYAYVTLGQQVLLALDDGIRGQSLWATNGTAAGTQELASVDPIDFAVLDGTAYFLGTTAGSTLGLWKTDGTAAGTVEVKDLSQYTRAYSARSDDPSIVVSGSHLYFITGDGTTGDDLWTSDGTSGGTSIVKDFAEPTGGSGYYGASRTLGSLTPFAGKLAFIADTGSLGPQLWITDGTSSGTQMLTDIPEVTGGTYGYSTSVTSLTAAGGRLYFFSQEPGISAGLWSSDGTVGNTSEFLLPNMASTDPGQPAIVPTPANLTVVGSGLVFSLSYGGGYTKGQSSQLWTTIGAGGGAQPIQAADGSSFSDLSDFVSLGGKALFQSQSSSGADELWATDGTTSGTTEVKVIDPNSSGYYNDYGYDEGTPLVSNGIVYFQADDGTDGLELWQSDGTSAGTFMVQDINPGSSSSDPMELGVVNNQLIITANDGVHGIEPMVVVPTSQESPPTIAAIPTQNATVGESFQLNLALYTSDPNAPPLPLTYSLGADAPSGLTIDPSSGLLSWPGSADLTPGAYTFTVTATDNSAAAQSASTSITLDVSPVEPPTLSTIFTQYIGVGHTFVLDVSTYASDPNYPPFPLTYQLISGPAGASIDPSTGVLTWATASNQATGQYPFTVEVSDNSSPPLVASQTFDVQVNTVSPPVIETIPAQSAHAGTTFTLNLKSYAYDPNDPPLPLTFALGSGAPAGASINPTTGILTWVIPSNETTGPQSFTLDVSDNSTPANTASKSFTITVYAPNADLPPVLSSLPTVDVTVGETQTSNLSDYATDPNTPPLPLTFSLGGNAPSYASIDPTTGVLTLSPPSGQATGPVTFTVTVADNESTPLTASGSITVYVNALQPPFVSTIPTQSLHLGSTLSLGLSSYAHDPNSPSLPLTYALGANAPSGASVDPTTGALTWTPDSGLSPGTYTIPFTVSDGTGANQSASGTVTVAVAPANGDFPPTLQTLPYVSVTVGETQTSNLSAYATDPNTPPLPLTFSLGSDAPSYASIDPTTGVLTVSPPSDQATGTVTFTVTVADNESTPLTASQPITVYVDPVYQPFISSIPAQGVTIGSTLSLDLSQYAHDGNSPPLPLTYTLGTGAPTGASIDPTTGLFTWTPASGTPTQTYTISFTASNGVSTYTATGSFTVSVAAPGTVNPPVLSTLPPVSVTVGETLTYGLSYYASDPNTPPLPMTYSLSGAPSYASINSTTGVLTLSPPSGQATGPVTFTVIVADNESTPQTASGTMTVTVEALQPPTLYTISTQSGTIGQAFTLNLYNYAYDPNSPSLPLTFALGTGAPTDASLNSSSGIFSWTPTASDGAGTYTIPFTVSDGSGTGQTVAGTLTIDVAAATVNPPSFAPIPPQSVTIGETLTLNAGSYASDPNTPPLPMTFSLGSTPAPPPGLSIDPTTGVLTWDTTASGVSAQAYTVTIVATDNSTPANSGNTTVTLTALAVQPPSVNPSIPTPTLADGQTLSLDLSQYTTDENTPALPLSYSLVTDTLPGATLDPTTGLLQWPVPSDQPAGPITVTFEVSDSLTSASPTQGSFTIEISSDLPPVIQTIPTTAAPVGATTTVDLSQYASDPNTPPQTLTYTLGAGAPTGASLDPSSGLFSWTPPAGQAAGPLTLGFTVTDTSGLSASGSFVVDVVVPPVIQTIPTKNAPAGQAFSLNLGQYASDTNSPAETLTYALTGTPPSGASVDPSTGAFSWTPPANQQPGALTFGFTVTDTAGLSTSGSFTVDVVAPPVLQSIPTQTVLAGKPLSPFSLKPYATDPNSPALSLSFSLGANAPAGSSINPTSGAFAWTPPQDQPPGAVTVDFTVTDSAGLSTSGSFAIDVVAAPVLRQVPNQTAPVGRAFQVNLGQFAADGNTPAEALTYTLNGTWPSGASIDPSTGVFSWTPGSGQPAGTVAIDYTVSNSSGAGTSGTFSVNVLVPPVLLPIPAQAATIGQAFTLDVGKFAADPNVPALPMTYSLAAGAPSGASIDPTTGVLTWTPGTGQPTGPATITVTVADNEATPQTASRTFTVNVSSATVTIVPPVLKAVSQAASVDVGQSFTLDVSQLASDPNTPPLPLTYSLGSGAPAGMSIDPSSGLLTWNVPANEKMGNYSATVIVSDNGSPAKTASETLSFTVVDPSPPPTVTSPTVSTKKGFSITLTFSQPVDPATASNPANYILTESKKTKPHKKPGPVTHIGLSVSFNPATGQVTLKAAKKPKAGMIVTLTVIGGPNGIAKVTGLQLAGNGSQAGTNYVATISGKKITPAAVATGGPIVVRTARPAELKRGPSSGAPGGPLALRNR